MMRSIRSRYTPASLALVNITVWNHVGKLYMTVKLHVATRKLLTPTRTGMRSLSRNGARIGSGATRSSTYTNSSANTTALESGAYTAGEDHCVPD